ncbi:NAD(P)-dependent oxidoreductase [Nitrosopumilus sp.]|nr:NAD(P)-dependent oxidoreductase [Nitrosopumilus sp.]
MKILVLGGNGLIGQKIVEKLKNQFTIISTHNKKLPSKNVQSVKISLPDDFILLKKLIEKEKPNIIINTMAYSNLDFCEENRDEVFSLHVDITNKISAICSKINSKIIFISTDYVFDGNQKKKYVEDDEPNPINYYGETKLLAERIVLKDPKNVVLRTSLVYGYGERVRFMKYVIENLKNQEKIFAYNDIFNSATNIDEFVESVQKVIENDASGIFHMVGSSCITRYDFAKKIAKIFGFDESLVSPISIKQSGLIAKRPVSPCLDNSKCSKMLGYNFSDIDKGILKILNNFKNISVNKNN